MINIIKWTGYSEGALPETNKDIHSKIDYSGNTIVTCQGKKFNCHPLTLGVYPIRWELSKNEY
jgi:hypothetical protein|tara:strand:- start:1265 stop:1453 length:189 start_codon:yes stop_codon:yes gene_type:complete